MTRISTSVTPHERLVQGAAKGETVGDHVGAAKIRGLSKETQTRLRRSRAEKFTPVVVRTEPRIASETRARERVEPIALELAGGDKQRLVWHHPGSVSVYSDRSTAAKARLAAA